MDRVEIERLYRLVDRLRRTKQAVSQELQNHCLFRRCERAYRLQLDSQNKYQKLNIYRINEILEPVRGTPRGRDAPCLPGDAERTSGETVPVKWTEVKKVTWKAFKLQEYGRNKKNNKRETKRFTD